MVVSVVWLGAVMCALHRLDCVDTRYSTRNKIAALVKSTSGLLMYVVLPYSGTRASYETLRMGIAEDQPWPRVSRSGTTER